MTAIDHSQLTQHLSGSAAAAVPCAFLIHGQEMLVERSAEQVVCHILGDADRDISVEAVEGLAENIPDAIEQLNTFSLLSGPKIILFKDAKLFDIAGGQKRLLDQIIADQEAGNLPKSAQRLLQLCGRLALDLDAARQGRAGFKALHDAVGARAVTQIVDYCLSQQWQPASVQDSAEHLRHALERGFPPNHYLIVTVNAKVPKNQKLYKTMAKTGWVIDCHVPTGERRADKMAQDTVLRQALTQQLARAGKKPAPGLFEKLYDLTGFDLRTFTHNVEKLIDYSGESAELSVDDIDHVLRRTKSDPVFQLTNAVADRNLSQALFYLHALLKTQWHPLQILAAIANQVRKLLLAKDFAVGRGQSCWSRGMSYAQFQQSVMPVIQAYDTHTRETLDQWNSGNQEIPKGKKGPLKNTEFALASNPNSAYPVYQTLLKSEKYTLHELVAALEILSQSDVRLKSTGQDPALVIKKTIADICKGR